MIANDFRINPGLAGQIGAQENMRRMAYHNWNDNIYKHAQTMKRILRLGVISQPKQKSEVTAHKPVFARQKTARRVNDPTLFEKWFPLLGEFMYNRRQQNTSIPMRYEDLREGDVISSGDPYASELAAYLWPTDAHSAVVGMRREARGHALDRKGDWVDASGRTMRPVYETVNVPTGEVRVVERPTKRRRENKETGEMEPVMGRFVEPVTTQKKVHQYDVAVDEPFWGGAREIYSMTNPGNVDGHGIGTSDALIRQGMIGRVFAHPDAQKINPKTGRPHAFGIYDTVKPLYDAASSSKTRLGQEALGKDHVLRLLSDRLGLDIAGFGGVKSAPPGESTYDTFTGVCSSTGAQGGYLHGIPWAPDNRPENEVHTIFPHDIARGRYGMVGTLGKLNWRRQAAYMRRQRDDAILGSKIPKLYGEVPSDAENRTTNNRLRAAKVKALLRGVPVADIGAELKAIHVRDPFTGKPKESTEAEIRERLLSNLDTVKKFEEKIMSQPKSPLAYRVDHLMTAVNAERAKMDAEWSETPKLRELTQQIPGLSGKVKRLGEELGGLRSQSLDKMKAPQKEEHQRLVARKEIELSNLLNEKQFVTSQRDALSKAQNARHRATPLAKQLAAAVKEQRKDYRKTISDAATSRSKELQKKLWVQGFNSTFDTTKRPTARPLQALQMGGLQGLKDGALVSGLGGALSGFYRGRKQSVGKRIGRALLSGAGGAAGGTLGGAAGGYLGIESSAAETLKTMPRKAEARAQRAFGRGMAGLVGGTAIGGTAGTMLANRAGDLLFRDKKPVTSTPLSRFTNALKKPTGGQALGLGAAGLGAAGLGAYLYNRNRKKKKDNDNTGDDS